MSDSQDDVRNRFDPSKQISVWFWETISRAQDDPKCFEKLTDQELINFANEMNDINGYFRHDPFTPPPDIPATENSIIEGGGWVISQGRDFFSQVWNQPALFWEIIANDEYERGCNFEAAAHNEWYKRHQSDLPEI